MSGAKPPARRRKSLFMATASGQTRLAPHALDAAASARMPSLLLLVAVAAAALHMATSENFYIYKPAVVDNHRVPANEIIAASQIETLHVLWLNGNRAAAALVARMPDLQSASIACAFPAVCTIQVSERQPMFEWKQGQTRTWVDVEGMSFGARGQVAGLTVVEAPPALPALLPGHRASPELVTTLLALTTVLPEIKQYRFTPEHGLEFSDPKGNWPVYLGVGPDMAERVSMWKALAANLAERKIRPKYVDVRYANAPFYAR